MKIRKRIKNAVFALFKEEILSCYDPLPVQPPVAVFNRRELEFREIKGEFKVQSEGFEGRPFNYEESLRSCKLAMFEGIQEYMKVDPRSVIEDPVHQERRIRISIFVGMKPT